MVSCLIKIATVVQELQRFIIFTKIVVTVKLI